MHKKENIVYNSQNMLLDLYLPQTDSKAVFVFFHGGGIESGSRKEAENFADLLTSNNIAVASVEYRMYPNASYPDFIEDCADAVLWVKNNAASYSLSDKIFIGGSSAGGYISMMLCFCKQFLQERGISQSEISGYIHNAGQPTAHFNVLKHEGIDPRRVIVDTTAPLYYIGIEEEYSPMLFLVSDNDMQNRFEQIGLTLSTLEHFGYDQSKIEYRLMHGKHCQHDKALDQNGDNVFGKIIKEFIEKFG